GDETATVGPGSIVFIPRNVVHRFKNVGGITGRMLGWSLPGGQDHYLKAISELAASGGFTSEKGMEISQTFDTHFPVEPSKPPAPPALTKPSAGSWTGGTDGVACAHGNGTPSNRKSASDYRRPQPHSQVMDNRIATSSLAVDLLWETRVYGGCHRWLRFASVEKRPPHRLN